MGKRFHLNGGSWNYAVSCFRCRDREHGLVAAARKIAHKWKSERFGIGKCITWDTIFKKSCFVLTRYTMHVNLDILHPHFPKYEKERLQIPKTRFAKHISAFCEFRFLHLQNQKTNIRKYVTTPFSKFVNNRLQLLISGFREITEKCMTILWWKLASLFVSVYRLLVNRIPVTSSIRDPTKSDCRCPTAGRTDHKPTFL